jgi:hypothetical protein
MDKVSNMISLLVSRPPLLHSAVGDIFGMYVAKNRFLHPSVEFDICIANFW